MNDERVKDLIEAHQALEVYAEEQGKALERIGSVCHLLLRIEDLDSLPYEELRRGLSVIEGLVQVDAKDPRKHAPKSKQG